MSKVICDICGTVYPESLESCPVCGCSQDFGLDAYEEELLMDAAGFTLADDIGLNTGKKKREIFDFDEVNREEEPEASFDLFDDGDDDDDDTDEDAGEEEPRSNTALVVILLILIVLLLLTAGFIFVRYFLPNMVQEEQTVPTTVATEAVVETEPEETTELTVPCTDIVIPGGKIELGKGGMWLMNVQVYPADTTDVLTYASHNEEVVTVSESGTVTAVGEGQTVIEVSCGVQTIKCNVVVDYALSETTAPTDSIPAPEAEETTAAEETKETAGEKAEETKTTEATEVPKETTGSTELKLKKNDITIFGRYVSVDLELDCDIPADKIKWFTMDSTVAIVHDGTVTATGSGITRIYGEYGGQQVECIIRCSF